MHPLFLALVAATFLLHWFVVPPRWRLHLILAANLAWAGFCAHWWALLPLALVLLAHRAVHKLVSARAPSVLGLALVGLIGCLGVFKLASVLDLGAAPVMVPVGLSYVIFRLIHVVMDVYYGRLEPMPLPRLLAYALYFPTFVAGPVDRYQRFDINPGRLEPRRLNIGLLRITSGMAKKLLLADQLRRRVYPLVAGLSLARPLPLLGVSYGLLGVLYLDFSAYSDIAVGSALLLGVRVMENFDWPLLKPSLPKFWRAWHISVYSFIRDYFFFPLFATRASEAKMQLGVMLTFVIFMLWHRVSPMFLLLGLYMGAGVAGSTALDQLKRGRPRLRRLFNQRALLPLFVLMTVTYIALGTLILHWDGYLTGGANG